ncbi:hypothetical protein DFH27DRAFT_233100 [Peziza echinospora]|nr:hypothetical protein DFH27DRAFT_233100 [Peziza echinospora]
MAFPLALPLAALLAGYIDAKADIVQDVRTITSFAIAQISLARAEKQNKLNLFFQLEARALAPDTRNRAFLIFQGRRWSYLQAYETVLRYGAWLKDRHGVRRDDIVALDFVNGPVFVWLLFGLWSVGGKAALVNYNLGGEALMHTIKTSLARLVLVEKEVAEKIFVGEEGEALKKRIEGEGVPGDVDFKERELLVFDEGVERVVDTWAGRRESDEVIGGRKVGEMGALVYTSGTTGLPKPANVSYSKAHHASVFVKHFLRLRATDVFYTCMPLYHSTALILGLFGVIQAGCTLSLGRRFSNTTFWPEVKASNATIIQYVGEICRYLLSAPKPLDPASDQAHCVRMAFGNGLRPEIWQEFRDRFNIPTIAEFYASTEGNSGAWNYNTGPHGSGAVGRGGWLVSLFNGRKSCIVKLDFDSELPLRHPATGFCIPAELDEPGELLWRLDPANIERTFQGYFNNPGATEKKILRDVFAKGDAWFRTGDVQKNSRDGLLYFIDRIGDTYRWKSENVSTNEVAETISKFHSSGAKVDEVNVYGIALPNHDGRAGCAAIRLRDGAGHPAEALMREMGEWAKRQMPKFMVPMFIRTVVRRMEVTGTNKFVKTALRAEGVDPEKVGVVKSAGGGIDAEAVVGREDTGERVWWLTPNGEGRGYVPFRKRDWDGIVGGKVKL